MNFYYLPALVASPETAEAEIIFRPVIPVTLKGPVRSGRFLALVDTGTDKTVIPEEIARDPGIDLQAGRGPGLTSIGGHQLKSLLGDVMILVGDETESVEWNTRVQFFRTENPVDKQVILGHARFLDYFNANFDGLNAVLTLTPNESLPKSSAIEIK